MTAITAAFARKRGSMTAEERLASASDVARGKSNELLSEGGFSRGDLVLHFRGWREYSVVPITQCGKVEDNLPDRAA
jgi:NADPH-dependent curcumin reductase CurA